MIASSDQDYSYILKAYEGVPIDHNAKQRKRNKTKEGKAPHLVQAAILRGEIPPISTRVCDDCGGQAQAYHHPDYNKPLEVVALCAGCHRLRHAKLGE